MPILVMVTMITLFSCNKEENLNSQIDGYEEKGYYPASKELAKQEVLEFLKTTKTYNSAIAKTNTSYQDREPSEGKWVMEGASNYLTNTNFSRVSSDTIIKIDVDVNNLLDTDGVIKMKGTDMSSKFDNVFSQLGNYATSSGKFAKLVDVNIKQVDINKTALEVQAVFGQNDENSSANAWPTTGLDIFTSAQTLEDSLNNYLYATVGTTTNSNGTISTGTWFSNVNIISNTAIGEWNQSNYGCSNCLWSNVGSGHPLDGNTNCFPPSAYDTYFNRGITLMNNVKNASATGASYVTGVIECDYEASIITGNSNCSSSGRHIITSIIVGVGNAY